MNVNNFQGRVLLNKLTFRKLMILKQPRRNCATLKGTNLNCRLLVIGGGSGGCSVAARFAREIPKNEVIIVEPSAKHYYQPMFTLVGGGVKKIEQSVRSMGEVLPNNALWIKERVKEFKPDKNSIVTYNNRTINYQYMVVACGLELNYHKVTGLTDALYEKNSGVCTMYAPEHAEKTFRLIQKLEDGNAIFTFPNSLIKCAGAPLKICLLAEDYTQLHKRRKHVNFMFRTSLPVLFAANYYAGALLDVFKKRNINIDYRTELIAIKSSKKEAVFRNLDKTYQVDTIPYSMLHVTPPMSAPAELKNAKKLVDKSGYLEIDKCTLQHVRYKNVFGLGDCTNLPTSKTAAAISTQGNVLYKNLKLVMSNRPVSCVYNGYTACPLITSYGKCILAEFDYERNPVETLPIDQRKELAVAYYLKRDVMPEIYWWCMKGFWNGPETFRKISHLGFT